MSEATTLRERIEKILYADGVILPKITTDQILAEVVKVLPKEKTASFPVDHPEYYKSMGWNHYYYELKNILGAK